MIMYCFRCIRVKGVEPLIVGRGLVIHSDEDDFGLGGHPESLTTGNSGKRIACATIIYTKK